MSARPTGPFARGSRDLTTGSIPRHLLLFSLPMLGGSLLQAAYSIVNAIWVGKGLGALYLAAVTVTFPVVFLLVALANGLTLATNILVSQHVGAQEPERVKPVVHNSLIVAAVLTVFILLLGELLAPQLVALVDTPADVFALSVSFLRVSLCALPAMFGLFLVAAALRGTGDAVTPLYFQAGGVALVALFDPLLMFGWLGFPRMGLNGTAVAQAVMQSAAAIVVFIYLARKRHPVSPDWARFHRWWHWPTASLTLRIGLPSMLQQALVAFGGVVVIGLVNAWGSDTTAAFGGAQRLEMVAFLPAMTLSLAAASISGQNIGARLYARVREVFWWGILMAGGITLLVSLLVVTQGPFLMLLFQNPGDDPQVAQIGAHYLRIVGSGYLIFAVMFVSNGIINGAGHTVFTTIITLCATWLVRVPVAWYLSQRVMHDVSGVWYAIVIGFAVSCVISLVYYASGRWKIPVVRHGLPHPAVEAAALEESLAPPELDCGGIDQPPCEDEEIPASHLDSAGKTA